jgi:hypothetical protein
MAAREGLLTTGVLAFPDRSVAELAHRLQGPGCVTVRLPDLGHDSQASGQRRGGGKLPAQCDTLGGVVEGGGQLVPLVQDLGQADVRQAQVGWLAALTDRAQRAQPASSAVLPDPAGAQTSTRPLATPSPSACARRGRGAKPGGGPGTCSLVASRTSWPDMATPAGAATGGSAAGELPQPGTWGRPAVIWTRCC